MPLPPSDRFLRPAQLLWALLLCAGAALLAAPTRAATRDVPEPVESIPSGPSAGLPRTPGRPVTLGWPVTPGWPRAIHPGVPVFASLRFVDDGIELTVSGEQSVVLPWLDMTAPLADVPLYFVPRKDAMADAPASPFPGTLGDEIRERVRTHFLDAVGIKVNGKDLGEPEIIRVGVPDYFVHTTSEPCVSFTLRTPVPAGMWDLPQGEGGLESVTVEWTLFDGIYSRQGATHVPLEGTYLGAYFFFQLREDEPSFTWFAPPEARMIAELASGELVEGQARSLTWTAATLAPLLGFGCLGLILLFTGCKWFLWGPNLGVAVVLAASCWPQGMPTEDEQLEIFADLHKGLYEAFQSTTVDGIYARLKGAVTPELLDDTYVDIYESLLIKTEGAKCRIEEYNVLTRALDTSDPLADFGIEVEEDGPTFAVIWDWEVKGQVSHWGHTHYRKNRYKARYEALHTDLGWRIHDVEVLEHGEPDEGAIYPLDPETPVGNGPAMILDTPPGMPPVERDPDGSGAKGQSQQFREGGGR